MTPPRGFLSIRYSKIWLGLQRQVSTAALYLKTRLLPDCVIRLHSRRRFWVYNGHVQACESHHHDRKFPVRGDIKHIASGGRSRGRGSLGKYYILLPSAAGSPHPARGIAVTRQCPPCIEETPTAKVFHLLRSSSSTKPYLGVFRP